MTYREWDAKRRELFPGAMHQHWESFFGGRTVAAWNPHTGEAWVQR